ncbi:hypothetical protein CBR_g49992 [Chara braunii]|uniref:Protein kinase domain-containing protein n=1 Tax=Chara braunii TaxID=69332 RepID=A0A388K565_CHABU|nr:hypothetical protein CBR_g49992 [Chara braunii]|eukprot:GBG65200.1 hypothetical protein CBR_g49992 [Chara braunii]
MSIGRSSTSCDKKEKDVEREGGGLVGEDCAKEASGEVMAKETAGEDAIVQVEFEVGERSEGEEVKGAAADGTRTQRRVDRRMGDRNGHRVHCRAGKCFHHVILTRKIGLGVLIKMVMAMLIIMGDVGSGSGSPGNNRRLDAGSRVLSTSTSMSRGAVPTEKGEGTWESSRDRILQGLNVPPVTILNQSLIINTPRTLLVKRPTPFFPRTNRSALLECYLVVESLVPLSNGTVVYYIADERCAFNSSTVYSHWLMSLRKADLTPAMQEGSSNPVQDDSLITYWWPFADGEGTNASSRPMIFDENSTMLPMALMDGMDITADGSHMVLSTSELFAHENISESFGSAVNLVSLIDGQRSSILLPGVNVSGVAFEPTKTRLYAMDFEKPQLLSAAAADVTVPGASSTIFKTVTTLPPGNASSAAYAPVAEPYIRPQGFLSDSSCVYSVDRNNTNVWAIDIAKSEASLVAASADFATNDDLNGRLRELVVVGDGCNLFVSDINGFVWWIKSDAPCGRARSVEIVARTTSVGLWGMAMNDDGTRLSLYVGSSKGHLIELQINRSLLHRCSLPSPPASISPPPSPSPSPALLPSATPAAPSSTSERQNFVLFIALPVAAVSFTALVALLLCLVYRKSRQKQSPQREEGGGEQETPQGSWQGTAGSNRGTKSGVQVGPGATKLSRMPRTGASSSQEQPLDDDRFSVPSRWRSGGSSQEQQGVLDEKRLSTHPGGGPMPEIHPFHVRKFDLRTLSYITNGFSDEYRMGEKGMFGNVYWGALEDQQVAVKVMTGELTASKRKQFTAEVNTLSRLHHSNLVRLVGYCQEDSKSILVYPYCSGGSLYARLHDRGGIRTAAAALRSPPPLTLVERMSIAFQIAKGLRYLHAEVEPPVIHRDVKSSNVLLGSGSGENIRTVLADFGLALMCERLFDTQYSSIVLTNHVSGTQGYMSPEYMMRGKLTEKNDVYAFGVILLELLTGRKAMMRPKGLEKGSGSGWQTLVEWVRLQSNQKGSFGPGGVPVQILDSCLTSQVMTDPAMVQMVASVLSLAWECVDDDDSSRPTMSEGTKTMRAILSNAKITGPGDERRLRREARERTTARRARVAEASARFRITASTGTTMATSSTMSQASSQSTSSGVSQSGSQASISQSVGLQVSHQAQFTPEDYEILQAEELQDELQRQFDEAAERRRRAIMRKARLGRVVIAVTYI